MRNICPFFLLFLLVIGVSAQAPVNASADSEVLVIEKKWRMQVRSSTDNSPTIPEDEDPFRANNEVRQAQRDIKENNRQNIIRTRAGLPIQAPPVRVRPIPTDRSSAAPAALYFYEVKVKNVGEKTIRAITWDYVFFEAGTKQEVGRRPFTSKATISPGKTKNITMRSISPPTGTINATRAGKQSSDQYTERIIIQTVEYTDGSVRQFAPTSTN